MIKMIKMMITMSSTTIRSKLLFNLKLSLSTTNCFNFKNNHLNLEFKSTGGCSLQMRWELVKLFNLWQLPMFIITNGHFLLYVLLH